MTEKPTIDPRYPAAFQRGHEGAREQYVAPQPASPRPESVGMPPAVGDSARHAPAATVHETPDVAPAPAAPVEPEGRNPFVAGLWVLSLLLSIGGTWFVVWVQTEQNYGWSGPEVPPEVILRQVAYSLSTPAITAGLLGIIGLLFWHAAAWRRRAIAGPPHP